jgi:enterochelin esterase-like enzyme
VREVADECGVLDGSCRATVWSHPMGAGMLASVLLIGLSGPLESPRLARLSADVAGGRREAVAEFWKEMEKQGTPLYEPGPDAGRTLVTFLWRGTPETRNVLVNFDGEPDFERLQLARLADTDVWHRTYSVPSEARFYYQFSPDDSLVPFERERDWGTREKGFTADPLNPKGILIGTSRRFSFAVLPGAPPIAAYAERPGVKNGRFDPGGRGAFQIRSESLGDHRVWIYTTPGLAEAGGAASLLLFLDGSGAWQLLPSVRMLNNLFHDGRIGPTAAVYVDSPDRERDLACSDAYLAFLVDEILPWVRGRYRLEFAAARTVVSGRSLGGLFAGYACLRRPDIFGGAMMQSPSLWWGAARDGENEWLARQFAREERVAARFFLAPGLFETGRNAPTSISILFSTRHLRDVLLAKGYPVVHREVAGGHDPLNWEVSLPEGVLALLGPSKGGG